MVTFSDSNRVWWILFSVIAVVFAGFDEGRAGRLQLVHADSALGWMEDGRLVRELIGNVVFRQDSSYMYCDRALQFVDDQYVRFQGHVLIQTPPRELRADEIFYFEISKVQLARGRARLSDRDRILTADSLRYFETEERALAQGRVALIDTTEQVRLNGSRMEYLRLEGYARAVGRPVFTHHDSSRTDSLMIISDYMEMLDDGAVIEAVDRVEITQGHIRATCGLLQYMKDEERIELSLNPVAVRDADRMRGVRIGLILDERRIDAIQVEGEGAVVTRVDTTLSPDPLFDFLSGEEIFIRLRQQQVDSVFVRGRAISYYHLFEQKQNKGINKVLGDEIHMKLNDGKMQQVDVVSAPAASSGIFYPQEKQRALAQELNGLIEQVMLPVQATSPSFRGKEKKDDLLKAFN
ncbi:hypothetical protein JXO59_10310 [candidate division KSB1 bacterium]|nr:hypothetical protein [candidate division KSB1 bacterium]